MGYNSRMIFIRRCFGAFLFVAFACMALSASGQSLYGSTGLIFSPTADVAPSNSVQIGLSTFSIRRGGITRDWVSGGAGIGLMGKLEVGGVFLHRSGGGSTRTGGGVFGKYQLISETLVTPSVAVGVDLIGGDTRTTQYYLALTKSVTEPALGSTLKVSAGVIGVVDRDGTRRDGADLFAGASYAFTDRLSVVAEWRSKTRKNPHDASGIVLMYGAKNYKLAIGLVNNGSSDTHRFFIGAGYNITTVD
jgi:hypothetical protein